MMVSLAVSCKIVLFAVAKEILYNDDDTNDSSQEGTSARKVTHFQKLGENFEDSCQIVKGALLIMGIHIE